MESLPYDGHGVIFIVLFVTYELLLLPLAFLSVCFFLFITHLFLYDVVLIYWFSNLFNFNGGVAYIAALSFTTITWCFLFTCTGLVNNSLLLEVFCMLFLLPTCESYNNAYTVVICIKRSIDIVCSDKVP